MLIATHSKYAVPAVIPGKKKKKVFLIPEKMTGGLNESWQREAKYSQIFLLCLESKTDFLENV